MACITRRRSAIGRSVSLSAQYNVYYIMENNENVCVKKTQWNIKVSSHQHVRMILSFISDNLKFISGTPSTPIGMSRRLFNFNLTGTENSFE